MTAQRMELSSAPRWLLVWLERLLFIAGTAMLAWSAALVADALIAQRNARSTFETVSLARTVAVPSVPDDMTVVAHPSVVRAVERGSPIAALSIPRIHLSAMVLHGSDAQTLRRGPGHLENTAFPGEPGNVVIAGHRDTFFWSLQNIHVGDDIFLDTSEGPSHYHVTSARVVNANEVSVLAPTDEPVLTLITCYPFSVLGPAPDRFVVRARRVDKPSAAPIETSGAPPELSRPASFDTIGATEPISPDRASDDQSLVQEAVGRYLRIQGARLVTRTDLRFGASPAFICDITFSDDRATADCNAVTPSSSEQEPNGRIFALERSDSAWAIRSVVLK